MSSRSATVLVIFTVACIAFFLATVFASMTGPISILPNESESGGVLDNLSAITDSDDNYDTYGYDDSNDYSQSYEEPSDDSSSEPQVETTTETTVESTSSSSSSSSSSVDTYTEPANNPTPSQSSSSDSNVVTYSENEK